MRFLVRPPRHRLPLHIGRKSADIPTTPRRSVSRLTDFLLGIWSRSLHLPVLLIRAFFFTAPWRHMDLSLDSLDGRSLALEILYIGLRTVRPARLRDRRRRWQNRPTSPRNPSKSPLSALPRQALFWASVKIGVTTTDQLSSGSTCSQRGGFPDTASRPRPTFPRANPRAGCTGRAQVELPVDRIDKIPDRQPFAILITLLLSA